MKNKIILAVLCVVLLLLFASSGYGGKIGPPVKIKGNPWQGDEPCQAPGKNGSTLNVNPKIVPNAPNIPKIMPIRFGNVNLLFVIHSSESDSDKHSNLLK